MSIYTTPLQFGYFLSLLLALIFLWRAKKEERLSDRFLAALMLILALELQDYTFGFAGINFLWEELNGFPRGVALLYGPVLYFYLRSQTNRQFAFKAKHLWHFLPWACFFAFELAIFLSGPATVARFQAGMYFEAYLLVQTLATWLSYAFYFTKSIRLYRAYRRYALEQFSDQAEVDLRWFKNFLALMIAWVVCRSLMGLGDYIFDWSFYQEWWWNLFLVVAATYAGLHGLIQKQPPALAFQPRVQKAPPPDIALERHKGVVASLEKAMQQERYYLDPELNLKQLAKQTGLNPAELSAALNQSGQGNFNDFVNGWRCAHFIEAFKKGQGQKLTILALALDSGFNSKATFNRAFRKHTGCSPREYFANQKSAPQVAE